MRRRHVLGAALLAALSATTPAVGAGRAPAYDVDVLRGVGGEPSIAVAPDGRTVIVTSTAPAFDGWYRSTDSGRTYRKEKAKFARTGNADLDIAFLDDTTVVAVDLSVNADGILVHRSTDRGVTWSTSAINYDVYDRPWVEHVGNTVYVGSRGFDQVPYLFVSTDGGQTFGLPIPIVSADADGIGAIAAAGTIVQHIAADERRGLLYVLAQHGADLYVSRLMPGDLPVGLPSFETHLAVPGGQALNGFNWLTVDRAGSVYVLAHASRDGVEGSWLSYSTDHGVTWSDGVEIGSPDDGLTTAFGGVDGGAPGVLSFAYLRGSESLPSDQDQDWHAEVAVVRRADTDAPIVVRARPLAKPVHTEDICSKGLLCTPEDNRNLLDFVSTQLMPDGTVYAVFGSDGPATGDTSAVGLVTGVVFRSRVPA